MTETLRWDGKHLLLLDQRLLPGTIGYIRLDSVDEVWTAINEMAVRGAPAIGVTAAYGLFIAVRDTDYENNGALISELDKHAAYLRTARPTAVNLSWALDRMVRKARSMTGASTDRIKSALIDEAAAIHKEDGEVNRRIGHEFLKLLNDGMGVLTHCNAGALATTAYGTALSPIYLSKEMGWHLKVYVDETRPRLQGSTLTAFELTNAGIDMTLITDSMAAVVMSQGKIDVVIVGCDRVAANGDTANKIGTLGLSVVAAAYDIPFYIAAPISTFDLSLASGEMIPIEERPAEEVTCTFGKRTAPEGVKVYNPSFDVTPNSNITAFVTEKGVIRPPYLENIKSVIGKA